MGLGAGQIVYEDDVDEIVAGTIEKHIGRCVASGTQALADGATVAIQFSAEEFDTGGFHSTVTNNTRFTPNQPGYYRFWGTVWFASMATPVTAMAVFRMNGSSVLAPAERDTTGASGTNRSVTVCQPFNGTTDYIELCGIQDSAGADDTNQSGQFSSVIEWEFVRNL